MNCDYCNKDISKTTNSADWRIELKNIRIPSIEGAVTDYAQPQWIWRDCYFCSFRCLHDWCKTRT